MGKITLLEEDIKAVEKDWAGHWRVHNGNNFVNGFKSKSAAIEFANKNNGIAVALCNIENGECFYTEKEMIY